MIRVLSPGFLSTIQDLGRPGFGHLGISASGAADALSLRIGNLLVGNTEGAPALEMTLVGGEYEFESEHYICLTGSDFEPKLNGKEIQMWSCVHIGSGSRLRFGPSRTGARCYLCIRGGFDIEPVLKSASTHLLTKIGGYSGRPVSRGDALSVRKTPKLASRIQSPHTDLVFDLLKRNQIRVTVGLQQNYFPPKEFEKFLASRFEVLENSDRMGLRLAGATIYANNPEIITEGAPLGSIQIPPSGGPIILFVEHQTTGGYPKIANVIAADIHRVGQLRPRDSIYFKHVTYQEALTALRQQEEVVESLRDL